jgi:ABC-type dipeptide/oligopeptide/nickel transport system permease component
VRALASGDLGVSLKTNRPIIREFQVRIPVTVTIAAGSLICALVIGLAFGLASVLFEGRIADHLVRLASVACHSVPVFIIGLILLYLFSFKLAWFPLFGLGSGEGLVLPICTLGLTMGFSISRLIRNSLLEAIHKEYFLAAIAKGLSYPQAISRHALKNAAPLLATYLALRFASLLGGTVLVESVFALPGMGSYVFEAISSRDYPVIQAYIVVLGVAVVLVNLAADLLVRAIAPRATLAGMN